MFLIDVGQYQNQGIQGNACYTYYHTTGGYQYSFSISPGGLSFTISPTTSTVQNLVLQLLPIRTEIYPFVFNV